MSDGMGVPVGYNTSIPRSVMTPDVVETRIGHLEFADGVPTPQTASVLWDHLDFIRGVETFLNCIPPALEAMNVGMRSVGLDACHKVGIADELLDSDPLFLTGNTDTVYASAMIDLERDGPTVVEVPPGCGPGTVNDAWFRFVVDMGAPGPDRGAGGRYLIMREDDECEVPDGMFQVRTPSSVNWLGGDYRWLRGDGNGGRHLDARTLFFYLATVNTPAMAAKMVGAGSQYAGAMVDVHGDALDGARQYRLRIPTGVPAKDFWSIVVYDPQTRSELQTGQRFPSRNSERDDLRYNDDGSVDLYFGPSPQKGYENNWIETVPGKSWFTILRLYGPLEAWFDQTWRPGDIEPIAT